MHDEILETLELSCYHLSIMRLKLLTVFLLSFTVIFVIRAFADYKEGDFPPFGLGYFLYWNFLYSLIPLLPAYFIFKIFNPPSLQTKESEKAKTTMSKLHPVFKIIITVLTVILGVWMGGYIGILFTADRAELDALTGGLYGAPIGAAVGLFVCWFIFARQSKSK